MSSSHCEQQSVSINCHNVPWTRELLHFRILVSNLVSAFLSGAYNSHYFFCLQIYFSDCVVPSVTQVHKVTIVSKNMTSSLWMVKACFFKRAVDQAYLWVTDDVQTLHGDRVDHQEAVVACVWDYEKRLVDSILFFNAKDFTWELEVLIKCV